MNTLDKMKAFQVIKKRMSKIKPTYELERFQARRWCRENDYSKRCILEARLVNRGNDLQNYAMYQCVLRYDLDDKPATFIDRCSFVHMSHEFTSCHDVDALSHEEVVGILLENARLHDIYVEAIVNGIWKKTVILHKGESLETLAIEHDLMTR